MNTLITGGAGFIGLNIAATLSNAGEDVTLFSPDAPPEPFMSAIRSAGKGRIDVFLGDVRNARDLDAALLASRATRLVHAAAITADLAREKRAAASIFEVNVLGSIEVFEACLRFGIRRVVQLGTGSVFGELGATAQRLDERDSLAAPTTLYGISKFAAERTGLRYKSTRDLNLTVVRLGTVFGPWEYMTQVRDNVSIPRELMPIAKSGGHAVVYAHSSEDWVYSLDVGQGIAAILAQEECDEPILHLSGGGGWSVADWCRRLQQRYPGFSWEFSDTGGKDVIGGTKAAKRSPMDIRRLIRSTGFTPAYDPDQALTHYAQWADHHL